MTALFLFPALRFAATLQTGSAREAIALQRRGSRLTPTSGTGGRVGAPETAPPWARARSASRAPVRLITSEHWRSTLELHASSTAAGRPLQKRVLTPFPRHRRSRCRRNLTRRLGVKDDGQARDRSTGCLDSRRARLVARSEHAPERVDRRCPEIIRHHCAAALVTDVAEPVAQGPSTASWRGKRKRRTSASRVTRRIRTYTKTEARLGRTSNVRQSPRCDLSTCGIVGAEGGGRTREIACFVRRHDLLVIGIDRR